MKNWIRDILLVGAGFAAGAYFMHVRMRGEYQKFADAQIEDLPFCSRWNTDILV